MLKQKQLSQLQWRLDLSTNTLLQTPFYRICPDVVLWLTAEPQHLFTPVRVDTHARAKSSKLHRTMRVKLCFIAKAGRRSRTWLGETGNQKRNRLRDSPFLAKVHTWRRSYRSILPLSLRMGTLSDHENSQAPPTWAAGMEVSMSLVGG